MLPVLYRIILWMHLVLQVEDVGFSSLILHLIMFIRTRLGPIRWRQFFRFGA